MPVYRTVRSLAIGLVMFAALAAPRTMTAQEAAK